MWTLMFIVAIVTVLNAVNAATVSCEIKEIWGIMECEFAKGISITEPDTILSVPRTDEVTHLSFSSQKGIEHLPVNIAATFPKLKNLYIRDCSLKSINYQNFKQLNSLLQASITSNPLISLDEDTFNDLENVEFLRLAELNLTSLPEKIFGNMLKLKHINVAQNELTRLEAKTFENNRELKTIYLQFNKLQSVEPELFETLEKLQDINLSHNQLTILPVELLHNCRGLVEIDISNNNIIDIPLQFLSKFHELYSFNSNNNSLSVFDLAIFDNNPKIALIGAPGFEHVEMKNIDKIDAMSGLEYFVIVNGGCNFNYKKNEQGFGRLKQDVKAKVINEPCHL